MGPAVCGRLARPWRRTHTQGKANRSTGDFGGQSVRESVSTKAVVIRGTGIVGIEIEEVTQWIEEEIQRVLASQTAEPFWVTQYGANDIHHRHLVS